MQPDATYPAPATRPQRTEPAPRRVRGVADRRVVFDTTRARYVWEHPFYPQYYVPREDVAAGCLVDEQRSEVTPLGPVRWHALRPHGCRTDGRETDELRAGAAQVLGADAAAGLGGMVRFTWTALDAWFEEDEEIFVHPRSPYVRVDALRSHRHVRVELDGVVLADTRSPVLLFETGLPTRYYVDATDVRFEHLVDSPTSTSCPYKGDTSAYWSARVGDSVHADVAWSYRHPIGAAGPVAGMVAFFNEAVDLFVDGRALP